MRHWLPRLLVLSLALTSLGFEWEGRLTRLRRELDSDDPARRREVVQLLSSYPASEVREPLLRALEDPDAGVRAEAAAAVGRVRLQEAVARLLDWLDDAEADVRAAATRALGQIGDPRVVPNLVRVLGDNQSDVRRAGIAALAAIGGDEVVVPILGRLDDVDARVRVEAATLLGHLGDARAVVPLVGRARDDATEVRSAVYSALGSLGDARAVPALVQGLRDEAPEPRLAAIAALGRLGAPHSVRPLVGLLQSSDARVPRAVAAALGQIPDDRAREALVEGLADGRIRAIASQALIERARRETRAGRTEDAERLVADLSVSLGSAHEPGHATQIATTLEGLDASVSIAPSAPALLDALREGRGDPPAMLRTLGTTGAPEALVPLLERLRSEEVSVRMSALEALRRYFERAEPDGRAADPLLAILGHVTEPEREPVIHLLGKVGARRALPTLRTLLTHRDPDLRLAAIRAIGTIGDPDGSPALMGLLADHDGHIRFEAARAMGAAASAEVVDALLERLLAREPTDRHAILLALARGLPRLEERGELGETTRRRALSSLERFVQSDDEALAARALDVIVAWGPPEATDPLVELLERAGPRRGLALARALGALDHDAARAALRGLLSQPIVALQTQAASVLGEHGGPEEAALLLERGPTLAWPASAAAAFALARLARRGILDTTATPGLCELATSHDPFVRANVSIALAALSASPCPSGAHPLAWIGRRHASVVRAAAARWAHAAASAGALSAASVTEALSTCASEPLAGEVAEVCARPSLPPLDGEADVFAYGADGERLLASRLTALRLADGTVWITRTDANGHLRLHDAPRGPLALEDPAATPLEP